MHCKMNKVDLVTHWNFLWHDTREMAVRRTFVNDCYMFIMIYQSRRCGVKLHSISALLMLIKYVGTFESFWLKYLILVAALKGTAMVILYETFIKKGFLI